MKNQIIVLPFLVDILRDWLSFGSAGLLRFGMVMVFGSLFVHVTSSLSGGVDEGALVLELQWVSLHSGVIMGSGSGGGTDGVTVIKS